MYKVSAPQDMNKTFAQARNMGDVEGLLSLFEPEAVIQEVERQCAGMGELRTFRRPADFLVRPHPNNSGQ